MRVLALGMMLLAACGAPPRATESPEPVSTDARSKPDAGIAAEADGDPEASVDCRRGIAWRRHPDPDGVYAVPVLDAPYEGNEHAWVTVVLVYDFESFSDRARQLLDKLRDKHGDDLKVVYQNLALRPERTTIAARAVCAAQQQGEFRALFDRIFDTGTARDREFTASELAELAEEAGLDRERFARELTGDVCIASVDAQQSSLTRLGARGVPAFFVNGRFIEGFRPEVLTRAIEEKLEQARSSGIAVDQYYEQLVANASGTMRPVEIPCKRR